MKYFVFLLFVLMLSVASMAAEEKAEPAWDRSDDQNFLPLGAVTREQILTLKVFNYNYVEYVPKSDPVQAIHNFAGLVEIKVFFGDWCKDSKKHIPAFIKTMEFADNKNIQIHYVNVSPNKKEPADLLAGWNVEHVPTLIVLLDGKEAGRMVENPKTSIDADLAEILATVH